MMLGDFAVAPMRRMGRLPRLQSFLSVGAVGFEPTLLFRTRILSPRTGVQVSYRILLCGLGKPKTRFRRAGRAAVSERVLFSIAAALLPP
jgi:hypothetical protein